GYRVFATARNPKSMEDLAEQGIETLSLDVTKQESIKAARDKVAELTGGSLNILVNNAGVAYTIPALDIDIDEVKKLFDVNVFGTMAMIEEFVHLLLASQDGRIANIGSIAGMMTLPFGSAYSASKAALHAYSDALRAELAPFGIQVTTIATGGVKTNIVNSVVANKATNLPQASLYLPVADLYHKRLESQQNADFMSAEDFARSVVKDVLRPKQKISFWAGSYSGFAWFCSTFLPRWVFVSP
ncbi:NAD(P)-binding protein, partial [Dentipellis sp. KUC8613]